MKKQDVSAALAFTGALLGAGFGSGRELWEFFARFGLWGLFGVALAGALFMALSAAVLGLSRRYHCRDHQDFCNALLPKPLAIAGDWVFTLFLFAGIGIMLSGGAAMAKDNLGIHPAFGVAFVWIPSFLAVAGRQKGVFASQRYLVPLMLSGLAFVSILALLRPAPEQMRLSQESGNWLVSSCLYVGYNMLGGAALLSGLANGGGDRGPLDKRAGLLGGGLVAVAATLPVLALIHSGPVVGRYQLPMLYLAYQEGSWLFYLYGTLFAAALISTVIANAYCLCQRFAKPGRPHILVLLVILLVALPLSLGSFSDLVAKLYGACGWAGIIFFAAVACYWVVRRRKDA